MKRDELGGRPYVYGVAEDRTFRVSFVCYKPYQLFLKNEVFRFENTYVHMFEDHSLLLVLTEYSRIRLLPEEPPEEYVWEPKIAAIHRPLGSLRVTLEGAVTKIYSASGLVRRCERCGRLVLNCSCPSCGGDRWYWSVRVSSMLSDRTGSINTVFSQYLTARLLGRPVSEILCLAKVSQAAEDGEFQVARFMVNPPEKLAVNEATVIEPSFWRGCEELIVPDRKNSKIYSPRNVQPSSRQVLDMREKTLEYSVMEDRRFYAEMLEKALDIETRRRTRLPKLHGIYLTEEPVPLYYAERAKLYLGFEVKVQQAPEHLIVEFIPAGLIRESVLDYVGWRRSRGASADSVEKALLKGKRDVVLAPNGTLGAVQRVLFESAGSFQVPTFNVSLPQFWKTTYGIEVNPEEKPLLVIKPYNLDVELTYPPSCVFLDEQSLYLKGSVRSFVEYKKHRLTSVVFNLARDLMRNLEIDGWDFLKTEAPHIRMDAERMIFNEIRRKLYGKTVKATGSIVQHGERLYFFPKYVAGVHQR